MSRVLPAWLTGYRRDQLTGDLSAGLIVTVMLVPQSLAYAMLAGLPPQMGLYASILPIIAYAAFGTSMTLAVGPVAVASLMTASALTPLALPGSPEYAALAVALALLSGVMLAVFGLMRLGFLAHFLSHPVISGFISGAAVLIAIGQLRHVLGVRIEADGVVQTVFALITALPRTNPVTLAIGLGSIVLLVVARSRLPGWLVAMGLARPRAELIARLAPMAVVILATVVVGVFDLDQVAKVAVVGAVPAGLPQLPSVSQLFPGWEPLRELLIPALLISLVGFVESVSVAQSFALKRRQRIDADRELLGLGAANAASALSGGFPVTGGLARSVVNFSAGANTPFAGVVSAGLMAVVLMFLTDWFHAMPHAVLAATILVAVTSLIDLRTLREAWAYDRGDALALSVTALGVIVLGVEHGIELGVMLSLAVIVWRGSRPHIAVVGRMPGTEHFRNVERHAVETVPGSLILRVDESLLFANAMQVRDRVDSLLAADPGIRRVLISCAGVNQIDTTALEMLVALESDLQRQGVSLLLAEVKGPVMDRLAATGFGRAMAGRVYLSLHDALKAN
jgi:SulP family sulfate permease